MIRNYKPDQNKTIDVQNDYKTNPNYVSSKLNAAFDEA